MSKLKVLMLAWVVCLAIWSMAGCDSAKTVAPDAEVSAIKTVGIGEAVDIGSGLSVTIVGTDSVPPGSLDSSPPPSPHWISFEVKNSSDSSVTLPSRPRRPTFVDANGTALNVPGISVRLVDGGGGWGPAIGQLGQPYLNPGGIMRVWCELPGWSTVKRPITVTYAPTRDESAVFTIE